MNSNYFEEAAPHWSLAIQKKHEGHYSLPSYRRNLRRPKEFVQKPSIGAAGWPRLNGVDVDTSAQQRHASCVSDRMWADRLGG